MFSLFRFWPGISWTVLQPSLRWKENVNLKKTKLPFVQYLVWHSPFPFQRRVLDLGSGCGATSIAAAMWVIATRWRGGGGGRVVSSLDAYATTILLFLMTGFRIKGVRTFLSFPSSNLSSLRYFVNTFIHGTFCQLDALYPEFDFFGPYQLST
jgi:hypothetical protein